MKKKRPDGWTKEAALGWLSEHPGACLADLCRAFETPACRSHALAYDVHAWRGTDLEFRAAFDLACPARNPGFDHALEAEPGMEDWKVRWAEAYLSTRDKLEASRQVGVSWAYVRGYLAERTPRFDPHFRDLVHQVESHFIASAESDLELATRIARDTADARTLGDLSLKKLERLSREKWGRNETVTHQGTVEHRHVVELRDAARQVEERSRFLFGSRRPAELPAPPVALDVVDVVPVPVPAEAAS